MAVVLPGMPSFTVSIDHLFHYFVLARLRDAWCGQLARFDFKLMAVPVPLFLIGQPLK
jgi:hypothetical protein